MNMGSNFNYLELVKTPCRVWIWRIIANNGVIIIENKKCYKTYQQVKKSSKQIRELIIKFGLSKNIKHKWLIRVIDQYGNKPKDYT